jgi:hypothetical protein
MKSSLFALSFICFLGALASPSWSDVTVSSDFAHESLAAQGADPSVETFAISGSAPNAVEREISVTRPLLRTRPQIEAVGPLGKPWVLSTGSSTKFRNVHWGHYVDLFYRFEEPQDGATLSLKYLNTRACGGRLDVLFAQFDESGNRLWESAKRLEDWELWPGPYSQPRGLVSERTWRSYSLSAENVNQILQGRKFNTVIIREFDITSEAGSGYLDDIQITAIAAEKQGCDFPEDTLPPAGAIHASRNLIWPPNNKLVSIELSGYVRDELSMARDRTGNGVSSAYLLINGSEKIVLKDAQVNRLDAEGFFSLSHAFKAQRNAVYSIELFGADTAPAEPNFDLIDSTCIVVPGNMSQASQGQPSGKGKAQ